jgi:hypothetical protein
METKEKNTATKTVVKEIKKDTWQIKDRNYYLLGNKEPLSYTISSRHSKRRSLVWFDEEKGYERELRYATNQKSVFVDEQEGPCTLKHIVFENGVLNVPKEKVALQKLLSLYHPLRNKVYAEYDSVTEAKDDLEYIELEVEALNAAMTMDIDQAYLE